MRVEKKTHLSIWHEYSNGAYSITHITVYRIQTVQWSKANTAPYTDCANGFPLFFLSFPIRINTNPANPEKSKSRISESGYPVPTGSVARMVLIYVFFKAIQLECRKAVSHDLHSSRNRVPWTVVYLRDWVSHSLQSKQPPIPTFPSEWDRMSCKLVHI